MKNSDIERMKKDFYGQSSNQENMGNSSQTSSDDGPRLKQPIKRKKPQQPKIEEEEPTEPVRKKQPVKKQVPPKNSGKRRKKRKKKHKLRNFFIVLLILIFLVIALTYWLINSSINHYSLDSSKVGTNETILSQLEKENSGYKTYALFGVDSRVDKLDSGTRTDSIILLCINSSSGEINMLSVYRDTYLNLGEDRYGKINSAYAIGGPERALTALNTNFDLDIKDYITVGFAGLADAIDELGGITIDVSSDEIEYINAYQKTMVKQLGKEYVKVTSAGEQTLNGIQAVSYCRIRYTSGSDYKRTQRQRTVLSQMIAKAKKSSPFALKNAMQAALNGVQTSLSTSQIMSLLPLALKADISNSDGVPFESYRSTANLGSKGDCVIPNTLAENTTKLHEFLYGTKDYEPSSLVKNYSDVIKSVLH